MMSDSEIGRDRPYQDLSWSFQAIIAHNFPDLKPISNLKNTQEWPR